MSRRGPGPNPHARVPGLRATTFVDHVRADGLVVRWESRRHRKHLTEEAAHGSTWWAPGARGWWIAVLFAVGSALFVLGALPSYANAIGVRWDSATFFLGSLFFTSAAFLTYREAVDAAPEADNPSHRRHSVRRSSERPGAEVGDHGDELLRGRRGRGGEEDRCDACSR